MNFDQDIREHVLSTIPFDSAYRTELEAKNASELLIIYLNWLSRLIAPRPRRIHVAEALKQNPLAMQAEYAEGLAQIGRLIVSGGDLSPHLSRSVHVGYQPHQAGKKKLTARKDLDLLLNDWGVHHLHLSLTLESDGFVQRTGPLLFGVFHYDDAYLIDVYPHGSWVEEEIIHTVVREWPDAGIVYEVKGVLPDRTPLTPTERGKLRSVALNTALTVGDKVYWPAAGLMSSGVSIRSTTRAQALRRDIEAFVERHTVEPGWLVETMHGNGWNPPQEFDLKFVFLEGGYGVFDQSSGTLFRLR